jgi:hypothetical protein
MCKTKEWKLLPKHIVLKTKYTSNATNGHGKENHKIKNIQKQAVYIPLCLVCGRRVMTPVRNISNSVWQPFNSATWFTAQLVHLCMKTNHSTGTCDSSVREQWLIRSSVASYRSIFTNSSDQSPAETVLYVCGTLNKGNVRQIWRLKCVSSVTSQGTEWRVRRELRYER